MHQSSMMSESTNTAEESKNNRNIRGHEDSDGGHDGKIISFDKLEKQL